MTSPAADDTPDRARPDLRQGDLVVLNGVRHMVVSRSCDLERDHPTHAVVAQVREATSAQELRGWELRAVPLPHAPDDAVADMTRLESIDKSELPAVAEITCTESRHARIVAHDVAQAFGEASHPDGVTQTFAPIYEALSGRPYRRGKPAEALLEAISDVRIVSTPHPGPRDEETDREVELVFVLDDWHPMTPDINAVALAQAEKAGGSGT